MIIYSFDLVSSADKADDLLHALASLEEQLRPVRGFLGSQLLRFSDRPFTYRLNERWESKEAHDSTTDALPKDILERVFASLDEPASPVRLTEI